MYTLAANNCSPQDTGRVCLCPSLSVFRVCVPVCVCVDTYLSITGRCCKQYLSDAHACGTQRGLHRPVCPHIGEPPVKIFLKPFHSPGVPRTRMYPSSPVWKPLTMFRGRCDASPQMPSPIQARQESLVFLSSPPGVRLLAPGCRGAALLTQKIARKIP